MLSNTVDRESVEKMVRTFYISVLEDDLVGPYFTRVLGEDLLDEKWVKHFEILNNFWLKMMNQLPVS